MQPGRLDKRAAKLRIGFAEKFNDEARNAVAADENADEAAGLIARLGPPERPPEHGEQHNPLQPRFIKLTGVACDIGAGIGKNDRPGNIGGFAPQFAVHEIGEAAEKQPERHRARDIIMHAQPTELVRAGKQDEANRRANRAAVKRHAAVPQPQDPARRQQHVGRIEKHIAQPTAKNDAQSRIKHQVIGMAPRHRRTGLRNQPQQIPPAD